MYAQKDGHGRDTHSEQRIKEIQAIEARWGKEGPPSARLKTEWATYHQQSSPEESGVGGSGGYKVHAGHIGSTTVCCQGHAPRVPAKHSDVGLHPGQSHHLVQQPPVAAQLVGPLRKRKAFNPLGSCTLDAASQARGACRGPRLPSTQVRTVASQYGGRAWPLESGPSNWDSPISLCQVGDRGHISPRLWTKASPSKRGWLLR